MVEVFRSILDSLLVRITVAPMTAAPLGSVTVPRSELVACPHNEEAQTSRARSAGIAGCKTHVDRRQRESGMQKIAEAEKRLDFMVSPGLNRETLLKLGKVITSEEACVNSFQCRATSRTSRCR